MYSGRGSAFGGRGSAFLGVCLEEGCLAGGMRSTRRKGGGGAAWKGGGLPGGGRPFPLPRYGQQAVGKLVRQTFCQNCHNSMKTA